MLLEKVLLPAFLMLGIAAGLGEFVADSTTGASVLLACSGTET
jgi:hypothetical protein